jgi:hypothetical protein
LECCVSTPLSLAGLLVPRKKESGDESSHSKTPFLECGVSTPLSFELYAPEKKESGDESLHSKTPWTAQELFQKKP